MKFNSKTILTVLITVVLLVSLLLVLVLTEKLLSIWTYLQQAPLWMTMVYAAVIMLVAFFGVYLYLRLIKPSPIEKQKLKPIDESSLRDSLQLQAERGVDVAEAQKELQELEQRRGQDSFHIALYGTVSSGKSSFIKALLPEQQIKTNVLSGTTRSIGTYQYKNMVVIDLPGLDDFDPEVEKLSMEETLRAHVVVFLTDSDLTQTEMRVVNALRETKKPLVLALNKSDRYDDEAQAKLVDALQIKTDKKFPVALISTGGLETIVYQDAQGNQKKEVQNRKSDIQPLLDSIEKVIENNPEILNRFRDASMLMLAQNKLNSALLKYNNDQAELVISDYTKKAVLGAMASVAPGSDLVIQGTLGTKMVQNLCAIYEISPKQMEIDQVIRMAGGKLKTSVSLVLAVAGNALKAFPGVGTAVGGVTHAVAYGMIFNALGHAVLETISTLGSLDAQITQKKFEENLLGPAQILAKDLAKMALKIDK